MPRGDGTGPMGMGPMTGRAAGYCAGYSVPGYANPIPGRGYGRGFGGGGGGRGGRGWRHRYYATGVPGWARFGGYAQPYNYMQPYQQPEPEVEKQMLKEQADALQAELEQIKKRLADIEVSEPNSK